ncbi:DUF541 domain-containing protein (plasmid) [Halorubrum sp. BOL3-1]|uniref:SIMPL domain-containing protein n=1 Tax=Halorubrum sp. BOL3-1 TaxID=2497325 RepID=UPI001004F6C2|nr:SIMPL domain-containing protein [Halorubrum sp. BOL3-1]QAU11343.1 DUF541 domain-containing protein [Halorubrum sp. BOL3-1]
MSRRQHRFRRVGSPLSSIERPYRELFTAAVNSDCWPEESKSSPVTDHTITVRGRATMAITPSYQTVRLRLSVAKSPPERARQTLHTRMEGLEASLKEFGVAAEQIELCGYQVAGEGLSGDVPSDETANATAELQFAADGDTARAAGEAVVEAGATVAGVTPTVARHKIHEVQEELVGAAMRDARRQADRIAASEGRSVDGLVTATASAEDDTERPTHPITVAHRSDIHPGPIEFKHAVEVTYKLAAR